MRPRPRISLIALLLLAFGLVGAKCAKKLQQDDPDYWPVVASPAYPDGQGFQPTVGVDETHVNRARYDRRYQGFTRLLEADGHVVVPFDTPYAAGCFPVPDACAWGHALQQLDVLVLVSATETIPADEAALLADWVAAGGSLLLVADHSPDPPHVGPLAAELGLEWWDVDVTLDGSGEIEYLAGAGLLAGHALSSGSAPEEQVGAVTTFAGSALIALGGTLFDSLLTLPPGSIGVDADGAGYDVSGMSQGLAIEHGAGRVYASAEARMFTALVDEYEILELPVSQQYLQEVCDFVNFDEVECAVLEFLLLQPTGETEVVPSGMHATPENEQYLLNVMHWLAGAI